MNSKFSKIALDEENLDFLQTSQHLDVTDLLLNRLNLLSGKDKLLMTMYLEKGNSFRQMARLSGVNETIVARRIRKLMQRLIDGEFIICLRNRDKFNATEIALAKDYFLTGLSFRKIAMKRQLTYYGVRKIIKKIQQVITTIRQSTLVSYVEDRNGERTGLQPFGSELRAELQFNYSSSRSQKGRQICLPTKSQKHSTGKDRLPTKPLQYAECSA